jgi:alcohol dehydrogenase class IV
MNFELATPSRIIFGPGTLSQLPLEISRLGQRPLMVVGASARFEDGLKNILEGAGLESTPFSVQTEPTTETVDAALRRARINNCDCVLGIGGGSVIDTGKAVAGLLTNGGDLMDYLEVIGKGKVLGRPAAPYAAIPTTAGTGAEVTKNAVIGSLEHRVKVSLRSPFLLPRLAVVDPELTYSMPPSVTASTGLDALTQVIEPFVSSRANPIVDALCREAIPRAGRSLRVCYDEGQDREAREDMALVSLCGGLALANAGLGAVHGIAGPLGGLVSAPHGTICARLLPFVMRFNIDSLRERGSFHSVLDRYDEIGRLICGVESAVAEDAVKWVEETCAHCGIPSLAEMGLVSATLPLLVAKAQQASSMKGNPVSLTKRELFGILEQAL